MAGPHHGHHGHHGGGRRRGWGGGWRGSDVIVLRDDDYCPPGYYRDPFGYCVPLPVQAAGGLSTTADVGLLALDKAWPLVDPQQRTFRAAGGDAMIRAGKKSWSLSVIATFDLIALIAGSALLSSSVKEDPNKQIGLRASAALDRTWEVLAKRAGYTGQDPNVVKAQNPSSPDVRGALPILEIVIVVVAVAAVAGVYAFAIWKASEIIERQLAISAESDELLRLHAEWQKIVDHHLEHPNAPWTPEEMQILAQLEEAQAGVRKMIAPPKPFEPVTPLNTTVLAVLAVAGGAGYYFFLRKRAG